MAIREVDIVALKQRVEALRSDADKARGAYEQTMERLREHGCSTLEQAEKKLAKLKQQQEELREKLDAALAKFEKTWGKLL